MPGIKHNAINNLKCVSPIPHVLLMHLNPIPKSNNMKFRAILILKINKYIKGEFNKQLKR
jgi:hypothetical protein